jgi:AcrR family transcriptional regulator
MKEPADANDRPLKNDKAEAPLTAEPALKSDARDAVEKSDQRDRLLVLLKRAGSEAANVDMAISIRCGYLTLSSRPIVAALLDGVKWTDQDRSVTVSPESSTRRTLLDAARAELSEHGHAGVGLRAVARRAGVSHAAPAHFFGDRSGLLTAVAIEGFVDLTADLMAVDEANPAAKLAALGRAYIAFGDRHPALMELMFRSAELRVDDAELQSARQRAIDPLVAAVAQSGVENVRQVTLISWALVHGLVVLSREGVIAPLVGSGADNLAVASALVDRYVADLLG